jgi:hypothetical protein
MALAAVGVALSAVSVISSFVGGQKASDAAKKQARLEARAETTVTNERLRQLDVEERVLRGETIAGYAGGGVLAMGGSPSEVLFEQQKEFARERFVTGRVGATRVQQSLAGGKSVADYYRYSSYANVAAGLSDIFFQLKK